LHPGSRGCLQTPSARAFSFLRSYAKSAGHSDDHGRLAERQHKITAVISLKEKDWVRIPSLWPGIWRVSRVLASFKEDRWSLDEPLRSSERRLVFCYRLFNDSWQRSFSRQSCEISFVRKVSPDDLKRIEKQLSSNQGLVVAFKKYQATAKSIDRVVNLGFGDMADRERENFQQTCNKLLTERISAGLTMDEVLSTLRKNGLEAHRGKLPQQVTLQLISADHELRGDRFVYRRYRTLAS
jgi:hypothetical protein